MAKSKNNRKNEISSNPQVVKGELASSIDWNKSKGFMDIARPDDDILKKHGYNMKIYRSLLNDEQVKACFLNQRIAGVIATPWEIIPASNKPLDIEIAEFVQQNLEAISFNEKSRKMLYSLWYGFQVGELIWSIKNGKVIIADIKVRNIERFGFQNSGELYLKKNYTSKEIMPDRKFWIVKNSGDNDDDVYGVGLAHICYWPVYLKRNGLKFWSIAVEKFAVPTAVGKYPIQSSNDDIRKILEALDSISTETSIAVPEGTVVELLEAIKSSGGDYEKFCKYLDQIIAKAILGQDGTSENGRYAGTAEVQENVKDLILKADADLLCESFGAVIKWLVEYNYPGAEPPQLIRKFSQPENLKESAEQDNLIFNMGFKPTLNHIQQKYGGEWEVTGGTSKDFAEGDIEHQTAIDDTVDNMANDWEKVIEPIYQPIAQALEECTSFAEFSDKMLSVYPQLDVSKLQQLVAEGNFKARLNGIAGVKND